MAMFNGIDYAIFALLFLSIAVGIARGLVKEIISLIAWVAAFVVATLYCVQFAALFPGSEVVPGANPIESVSMVAIVISYLVLFFGILIIGSVLKMIVNHVVEGSGLSVVNRLSGAVFGFIRGCVIVLIALFFLGFTALAMNAMWKESKLVSVFKPGVQWINRVSQPYLAQIEAKMKKTAKSLNDEEMSDVIKTKPAAPAVPVVAAPAPTLQTAPQTK